MKYIVIGLGIFGTSLAKKLTEQGHEVIGVDNQMEKVETLKESITHAICLNSKDELAIKSLPLKTTDIVIVCIGEDEGANIMTTALLKKMKVKRIISRSISPLHQTILEAMGITEIVCPEEETADRWGKKLTTKGVYNSFEINKEYSILEVHVPEKFYEKSIGEIGFNKVYNVLVLTIMRPVEEKNMIGTSKTVNKIKEHATADTILNEGDIIVLYGTNKNIQKLLDE